MENLFLNCIQLVSDNRFWIMPIALLVVMAGIAHVFVTGFEEE